MGEIFSVGLMVSALLHKVSCCEPLIERGGADATAGTQLGERQCGVGTSECGGDALVERAWRRRCRIAPVDEYTSDKERGNGL